MTSTQQLEDAQRLQQAGRTPEAARAYSEILRNEPGNFHALYQLGLIFFQYRQFPEADRLLYAAARVNSGSPELFYNRGCVLQHLGRHEEALASFAHALAIAPDFLQARNNRGVTLLTLGRPKEALASFDRVLKTNPQFATVVNNRATALIALRRFSEARDAADAALRLDAKLQDALFNRGSALAGLGAREEALLAFEQTLAIAPQHADALIYRGILLEQLNRPGEALDCYDAALGIRPANPDILFNRTSALRALGRFEQIIADCDRILTANPHYKYVKGTRLYARLQCCDWENFAQELTDAVADQRAGYTVFQPLQAVTMLSSEQELRECSRVWVQNEFPPSPAPFWNGERFHHDRIRIAYVSADFGFHPVMLLAAGLFEHHDRTRFEITGISTGADDGSDLRRRLESSFEHFIDAHTRGASDVANLIREREIDIAVDLMGFTQNAPTAVFAHRPAPIQVNYLGFPGTTAARCFDYIIADRTVISGDRQSCFSENVVWLPGCCLPNDNSRRIDGLPDRRDAGLPEKGFVFSNFGKAHKITPDIFACWIRLLAETEGSVLWLAQCGAAAERNLRRESERHGITADRIIFAPFVDSPEQHLARISLADLYLDTFPYNAHATACDFLWAGVPVLTLTGGGFAGRVGAGVLAAAGLSRLITHSLADYEALALRLAQTQSELHSIKTVLAENRATCALFDTRSYTRHLESAYALMWRRHQRGEAPASFAIEGDSLHS